jgi:hypothetical protein
MKITDSNTIISYSTTSPSNQAKNQTQIKQKPQCRFQQVQKSKNTL